MGVFAELLVVVLLILLNGFLALAELAIVSARRARLQAMERAGISGARTALDLAGEPSRFLPTIQIGITLVGVLAGAFGGATLSAPLAAWLSAFPSLAPAADTIAFGTVVVLITYVSLIIGELVPKQVALRHPERVASRVAPVIYALARLTAPIVWLLGVSSRVVLWTIGGGGGAAPVVTEEEVRALVQEGARTGVLEHEERQMIERVMRLPDKTVRAIMTPRTDVVWLDRSDPPSETISRLRNTHYSRLLVSDGRRDNIVGIVLTKDLLDRLLDRLPFDLEAAIRAPIFVPDTMTALDALEKLRQTPIGLALVVDEYGSFEGVVTASDCLEAIVGELASSASGDAPQSVRREDGSWLVDGMLGTDELLQLIGAEGGIPSASGFHTVGGFMLERLRRVPREGDKIVWGGYRFEVVDMDGRRVDKVLVRREPETVAED